MVELVGDPCIPSELIVPVFAIDKGGTPTLSGAMWISGAKLYYNDGNGNMVEL